MQVGTPVGTWYFAALTRFVTFARRSCATIAGEIPGDGSERRRAMLQTAVNRAPIASTHGATDTTHSLRGRRLLIARLVWLALAALAVAIFAASLPHYLLLLKTL